MDNIAECLLRTEIGSQQPFEMSWFTQSAPCLTVSNTGIWSLCCRRRVLLPLSIYNHNGKPRSSVSLATLNFAIPIWLVLQIQPKSSPLHITGKFPQIALDHTDLSSLMLWPCHQSDHFFFFFLLFLDRPRFVCCLGLPSGHCHTSLSKGSQGEQYITYFLIHSRQLTYDFLIIFHLVRIKLSYELILPSVWTTREPLLPPPSENSDGG